MNETDTVHVLNGLNNSGASMIQKLELQYANFNEASIESLCRLLEKQENLNSLFLRHVRGRVKHGKDHYGLFVPDKIEPKALPNEFLRLLIKSIGTCLFRNLSTLRLENFMINELETAHSFFEHVCSYASLETLELRRMF